jgi:hypothetical protein
VRIAAILCTFLFAAMLRAQDTPSCPARAIETGVTAMTAVATALLQ